VIALSLSGASTFPNPEPDRVLAELSAEFGFPVAGVLSGEPIPDLRRIPEHDWGKVLVALSERARLLAIGKLPNAEQADRAMEAWLRAPPPRVPVRRGPRYVRPPEPRTPPKRGRQVNVRLYGRDFRALTEAARLAGTTHTELAKWFIVSGARRMLFEDRRGRAQTAARPSSA
jgi:hypothetical protein